MEHHLWHSVFVFIAGGIVKGVSGIGLPMVTTPLMASLIGVAGAVVVVSMPVLMTNGVQVFQGGNFRKSLRRFSSLTIFSVLGTLLGTKALASFSGSILFLVLGVTILVAVVYSWLRPTLRIPVRRESWISPGVGLFGGILGGLTSISAPPLVIYLYCLGLSKEEFVSGISLIYLASTVARIGGLVATGLMTRQLFLLSLLMCIPVAAGFVIGQRIFRRINQKVFFRFVLTILFVMGLIMIRRGLA